MRVMLRLTDRLAAILKDHHAGVARGQVAVEIAPEFCDLEDLINAELGKAPMVVLAIDHHVRLTRRWHHWRKVVGMQPNAALRANLATGNILTERARARPFTPIHTTRCVDQVLT